MLSKTSLKAKIPLLIPSKQSLTSPLLDSLDNSFIGDYYYNENIVIVNGLKFNHISILFLISIVFLLIGILKFNSRDLNN